MEGGAEDFAELLELMASSDPANADSLPTRFLWRLRDRLGSWFNLGRISAPVEAATARASCRSRARAKPPWPSACPTTCAARRRTWTSARCPSCPLYRTDDEFAAEISNQTVHGVMHLAWAEQGDGRYQGQMAVYVKPRGRLRRGIHGADQAVPIPDRLPGADAADRADVEPRETVSPRQA